MIGSAFLDQNPPYLAALGPGLVRDEGHAEDLAGDLLGFRRRGRELDSATLAASPCVDLRLDDHGPAKARGDLIRLKRVRRDFPAGDRHAKLRHQLFRLKLMNFHDDFLFPESLPTRFSGSIACVKNGLKR